MSRHNTDTRPFLFKQFGLSHHQSTMKVGIDATLLGIWVDVTGINMALDIGTGSGVIALLLASRGVPEIDAIDIDRLSISESNENFIKSPFSKQLHAHHQSLEAFGKHQTKKYDLIVSNPPFFDHHFLATDERINNARHTRTLTHSDLIQISKTLLMDEGRLCVVLPYSVSVNFKLEAQKNEFFLRRQLLVFPKRGLPPNRINMEFSLDPSLPCHHELLTIREEDETYSSQFKEFVSGFYLE